ncbi:hypothetical protein SAMD00019534_035740 [Acytostelium subglobosum LB1]|uniref:hypothetical protein n=1 Tax=Acytostelium subglobosum LB1 TaxID=1410327 RepID=UPI000644E23F|nr:hypothetical protein SAMD00019534_035740 [Acytostelium subglobosum LB1]GAM20399.1 hypothetical protein SAMD00019534_035740 [Acytostelium subglobosum LB1]|eukprot:XP_012759920.1 hypothetical protein SAMD00019534_035740 [Acytostelium subglobosum LB1]
MQEEKEKARTTSAAKVVQKKDNNNQDIYRSQHDKQSTGSPGPDYKVYYNIDDDQFDLESNCMIARENKVKGGSVDGIYYVEEYINKDEEQAILDNVYCDDYKQQWVELKKRRLQNWGGNPSSTGMLQEPMPTWLDDICNRVFQSKCLPVKPNHVLLNEYSYDQGIMPHKDGPLFYNCVTILSLGSTCLIDFYKQLNEDPVQSLLLQPRSLLIFTGEAYKTYFHGIKESFTDVITEKVVNRGSIAIGTELEREVRVSLTIRIVPRIK